MNTCGLTGNNTGDPPLLCYCHFAHLSDYCIRAQSQIKILSVSVVTATEIMFIYGGKESRKAKINEEAHTIKHVDCSDSCETNSTMSLVFGKCCHGLFASTTA